ncbi:hypothetical protein [Cryobacterium sp. AP23]
MPLSALVHDDTLGESPKATSAELQSYVRHVADVYARLQQGFTESDFRAMAASPLTPDEKQIAETYRHLFSTSRTAQRIEAEFIDERGLVLTQGRHRALAAQKIGVPFLPVHVRAVDNETLARLSEQLEHEVAITHPGLVVTHRALEQTHREARLERGIVNELTPDPERSFERLRERER